MKMVDFQFEHLELFDWRQEEYGMFNTGSDFVNALLAAEEKGECYTVIHDGRILVIGGIVRRTQKTGYAFTIFSKYADGYKIMLGRLGRRMFDRMMEDMGLHRITTYNRAGMDLHGRWCEWLGFKREGVVPKFDDEGNDYVQYGKVR